MNELVILEKGNIALTNSLIIANGMKLSHHSVTRLIDKYLERLNKMGEVVRFEIDKPKSEKGGRPVRIAWLNKKQFLFLATLMRNSNTVLDFKETLINEFERLQNIVAQLLTQRQNTAWLEQRKQGILARNTETDVIKTFTEYSKGQGSTHAEMYYANITKMENKALFLLEQKFPNVRNALTGYQLSIIASADMVVSRALKYGMKEKMHYSDIYQMAKERIEQFSELVGKTNVPMALQLGISNTQNSGELENHLLTN